MKMYREIIVFHILQLIILQAAGSDLSSQGSAKNLKDCLELYLKAIPARYGYKDKRTLEEVMGSNDKFCRGQVNQALFSIQQPHLTREDVSLCLEILIEYEGGLAYRREDGQLSPYERYTRLLMDPGSFRCELTLARISEAGKEVECHDCNIRRYLDELEEINLSRCSDDIRSLLLRKSDHMRGNILDLLVELASKLRANEVDNEVLEIELQNHIQSIVEKKKPKSKNRAKIFKETLYQVVEYLCQMVDYSLGDFFKQFSKIMLEQARIFKAIEKEESFVSYKLCKRLMPLVVSIKKAIDR